MTLLVTATIQLTIIMGAALAACLLLRRRSAALRHAVLTAAVLVGGAAPLLDWIVPRWEVPATWNAAIPPSIAVAAVDAPALSRVELPLAPAADPPSRTPSFVQVATSIWLLGALMTFAGLLAGVVRLVRLTRRCTTVHSGVWRESADAMARRCGLTRDVVLLQSADASLLLTWGIVRPCIVLPSGATTWTKERRDLVLAHEMAHIQRCDWMVQVAVEIVRIVHWFNPLVWIAARRLRYESECACDDAVLTSGVGPTVYASHLLAVARDASSWRGTWASAPAVAEPSTLERRIAALLQQARRRDPVTRRGGALVLAGALAVTVPVVALTVQDPASLAVVPDEPAVAAPAMPFTTETPALPTSADPPAAALSVDPVAEPLRPAAATPSAASAPLAHPASVAAPAQPTTMDVTGTVVDADGVLPGARVVLRNTEGQEYSRWTEANGRFRFGDVAAGRYVLVASLSGFRTITSDVEVVPGRVTDQRITLPVGDVFENVTVVCGGSLPQAALSPVLFDVRRGAGLPGASRLARVSTTRSMNPPLLLQSAGSPQLPVRVGGHVVPPTKLGRVNPVHPLCRQPDVSPTATVLLEARISADGRVEDIRDVTPADAAAPAALVNASVDAVRQWTYTPVMLNGRPTAADLRVTIRFVDERR